MYIIDLCLELIDMRDGLIIGNLHRHEYIELLKDLTTNMQQLFALVAFIFVCSFLHYMFSVNL